MPVALNGSNKNTSLEHNSSAIYSDRKVIAGYPHNADLLFHNYKVCRSPHSLNRMKILCM